MGSKPADWRRVRLGDLAETVTKGESIQWQGGRYVDHGIPFLRTVNVTDHGVSLDGCKHIEHTVHDRMRRSQLRPGDLLLSIAGTLGRCGLIPDQLQEANINQDVALVRLRGDSVNRRFILAALRGPVVQEQIDLISQGGTRNHLNLKQTSNLDLLLPPLPEQRKIAAILASVDDAIEKTQAVIDQVQVVKKGLMQELLTRGLPGRHKKFKKTEVGEIPEEWEVLQLEHLGESHGRPVLRTGPFGSSLKTEHFRSEGTPVLNIQCLGEGEILRDGLFFVDDDKARELSSYEVREGDLVFSRVADVGRSVVVPVDAQGWIISSNLMRISLDRERVDPHFLMYSIVGSDAIIRQIDAVAGQGGRAVVSSPMIKRLVFPIPQLQEQQSIVAALRAVEGRQRQELSNRAQLSNVKAAMMSVLLSGEVRVKPDPEAA